MSYGPLARRIGDRITADAPTTSAAAQATSSRAAAPAGVLTRTGAAIGSQPAAARESRCSVWRSRPKATVPASAGRPSWNAR